MAKITAITRLGVAPTVTYPAGFSHAACGCKGCKGESGNCVQAVITPRDVVAFTLDDGRSGAVNVAPGAADAAVTAAIGAWAAAPANAKVASPLIGVIV